MSSLPTHTTRGRTDQHTNEPHRKPLSIAGSAASDKTRAYTYTMLHKGPCAREATRAHVVSDCSRITSTCVRCKPSMLNVGRGVASKRTDDRGEAHGHGAAAADALRERDEQPSTCLHQARPSWRTGADLGYTSCSSAKSFQGATWTGRARTASPLYPQARAALSA